jgi:hypothetical protein
VPGRFRRLIRELFERRQTFPRPLFLEASIVDPDDQRDAQRLRATALRITAGAFVDLPVQARNGLPTPFVLRAERPDPDVEDDPYRYLTLTLLGSREAAETAARRKLPPNGEVMRYVVELDLRNALVFDAVEHPQLSWARLHRNDPLARQMLKACRDAGADLVLIRLKDVRSTGQQYAAVMFQAAVGDTVQVIDEAPYIFDRESQRWNGPNGGGPSGSTIAVSLRSRLPLAPRRISHWSARRFLSFAGWELLWASIAALLINPIAGLSGASVRVPVWSVLVVTLPLGWYSGKTLLRAVHPRMIAARLFMREVRTAILLMERTEGLAQDIDDLRRQILGTLDEEDERADDEPAEDNPDSAAGSSEDPSTRGHSADEGDAPSDGDKPGEPC